MIDIKLIRENPGLVKENIKKRFKEDRLILVDKILKKDTEWRGLKGDIDALRSERNKISKEINEAKKKGKDDKILMTKARSIPDEIAKIEARAGKLRNEIDLLLMSIPNIIHKDVPIGRFDSDNVIRETIGKQKTFSFEIKNHAELGEELGVLDFDSSRDISGTGFYVLKGDLALLNQALINYARDFMIKKGYLYIEPPLMIRENVLKGVYSKAEIDAMSYKVEGEDLFLIATSEHPLIGMYIGKMLNHKQLPLRLTAYSMCFRKEIGSHGIDEKGIYRTHQFNKQEMVIICHPDDSWKFYDELLNLSKELFKGLGIPIIVKESCSGDLSDLKARGADIEAWSPRQNKYFEVTSVTNMTDAQARRLGIKFVDKDNEKKYVHTLNNTAIATSRALVAIMENYQQKDGSIRIPDALVPYMNGRKFIRKN